MQLRDVVAILEDLVPLRFAESWDNVGLLLGDPSRAVTRVLFCVDATPAVLEEASAERCELVVAYHPLVFEGLKRVVAGSPAFDALSRGLAVWSPHSALDVVPGGTSDALADALGLAERRPLRPRGASPSAECKVVTFVPEEQADRVADALAGAGAGVIGGYGSCSFRLRGTGTFLGGDETNPVVGQRGRLERVTEVRLEMVAPLARLAAVVSALRRAHPYEEPAFDVVALHAPPPGEQHGLGRIGAVPGGTTVATLLDRVRQSLGVKALLVAGPGEGEVAQAACAPGSCGDLWRAARDAGAALYLTGEMRHHEALAAARAGLTVACLLHSHSERAALPGLAGRLVARAPSLVTRLSDADDDPFVVR